VSPPDDSDGDDRISDLDERGFETLEDTVDRLAAQGQRKAEPNPQPQTGPVRSEEQFEAAVRMAIDGLPDEVQQKLDDIVITVSDEGHKEHAYGMYIPGTGRDDGYRWWFFGIGRRVSPTQIVIYRDTLLRDYGSDPARLRAQITQTVRHEVGHALGFGEADVRRLGL
jgi:predicted Zn-dependent protease with MMP-like domain